MAIIRYARTDEFWRRGEKYDFLDQHRDVTRVEWQEITPRHNNSWMNDGIEDDFDTYIPIGSKHAKSGKSGLETTIFSTYSTGLYSGRDSWVYNFSEVQVSENIQKACAFYNQQLSKWRDSKSASKDIDNFVEYQDRNIKWSRNLKRRLEQGVVAQFDVANIKKAIYRPYQKVSLYFDNLWIDEQGLHASIFNNLSEDNRLIWLKVGSAWPMFALMVVNIPDYLPQGGSQCFPFYTYDEDGGNRRENITDWALAQFHEHYADPSIDKWAIFHYVYALLHHPGYREKYAANLRRSLPRIPLAPDFWSFAEAGRVLAEMHVGYETQPEYPLDWIENRAAKMDFRVERMKLARDRRSIRYNDFLTLGGIPERVFDYKLGNRSALEWIIDRYGVSIDKRSGIANDPNRYSDDPQYIIKLIGKVVHLSVKTVKIVETLSTLAIGE